MPVVQWNIATRWFGTPYFRWDGYGVRCRVVGSVQNCVHVCAIVVGLDGECACCGGCVGEHGRWQSGGVVLVSVGLGSDRPFEVSLADVVKAMESAKAIIREDVQRGGRGRRGDQCCLVHATEDVGVERDASGRPSLPADRVRLNGASTHGLYTVNVFMLMMNRRPGLLGGRRSCSWIRHFPERKRTEWGFQQGWHKVSCIG